MRLVLTLATALAASSAAAELRPLYSPGPPPEGVDQTRHLHLLFDIDPAPSVLIASNLTPDAEPVQVVDNSLWMPREASWQTRGLLRLWLDGFQLCPIDLFPETEILANEWTLTLETIGGSLRARQVTVADSGSYSRTFTTEQVPEPGAALLASAAVGLILRWPAPSRRRFGAPANKAAVHPPARC